MYKYIITMIIVALFAGCSAPKPKYAPSWYTSPPKDYQFFYAVGSGHTVTKAKNNAIVNLRKQIKHDMDSVFTRKTTKLNLESLDIKPILQENEHLVNTMSLLDLKMEKTAEFKEQQLILLKIPRKSIFDKFKIISSKIFKKSQENYALIKDKDSWLKKYSILYKGMEDFNKLASIIEAKRVLINSYNNSYEINYLNKLRDEYLTLKNEISIYVLPDLNSRVFVKDIKDAISATGLEISSKPKSEKALKLFITSETKYTQDYGFNKSESLVKYSTYDLNKEKISFRQHTFSAKSRKSYGDAVMQSSIHQKGKIKKLGIFDFLGVK